MGNSFGSYSEPGTRNSYEAEISPMVRDDMMPTSRPNSKGGGVKTWEVTVAPNVGLLLLETGRMPK